MRDKGLRPLTVVVHTLGEIVAMFPELAFARAEDGDDAHVICVTGVAQSSQLVQPGDLYVALSGARFHGADFAPDAARLGACAILTDSHGVTRAAATGLPILVAANPRVLAGKLAAVVFGHPSRKLAVVGITGTNGKTTTSYLVESALRAAGHTTALIGTVGARFADQVIPTPRTTPEPSELQALLASAAEYGVSAAVMEVSSHALALHRVTGTEFAVGAFTNLSVDHLDLHRTMEDYFDAKAQLFDGRSARKIVAVDDEAGRRLAAMRPEALTVATDLGCSADWRGVHQKVERFSQLFDIVGPAGERTTASVPMPGDFNVANALLAIVIAVSLHVPLETAIDGVAQAPSVPGRMERVIAVNPDPWTGQILAIVDYAHAPAGVTKALAALRAVTSGRLICVLGCGGDRDVLKRPLMGEAAARGADVFVATDDNPRSEDPAQIRTAMLAGAYNVPAAERASIVEIDGRAAAIAEAVRLARPGDTVAVLGKGHETGQEIAGIRYPFDDRDVLRQELSS